MAPSRYAFIKSLATKQTPTLLYEAPSHFWFYFGCWTSGVSIVAWTALTGPSVVHQPEGVPQWVGITFGASYVLLGAMGFYLLSKTPNIVSSIRVLPPPPIAAAAAAAGTQAAAAVGLADEHALPGRRLGVGLRLAVGVRAQLHERDEALPAGEHLGVVLVPAEGLDRLLQRRRRDVLEAGRIHRRPPFRSRRWGIPAQGA